MLTRLLTSYLFKLFILLLALVASLVMTFHSPSKIENSLNASGVYNTFVSSALQEIQKSNTANQGGNTVPIDDPAIKAAATQAFTPELLQTSTENVLNGTYDWLSGKTPQPKFKIDLSQAKQTFANGVGAAAAQRVSGLPVCTTTQLQQLTQDIDPFSVSCQPPGYNITAAQNKVTNDIATSKQFLRTPVITPQSLPKDNQGKTVFDRLAYAPRIYKWINASPWLLAFLAIVFGAITLALYDSKRQGLRNLAISTIGTGIFLLIISYVNRLLFNHFDRPGGLLGKTLTGSFQQTAIKAANSISHSILAVLGWFAVAYVAAGVITLLVLHFTKPKITAKPQPVEPITEPKKDIPLPPKVPKPRPLVQ
jgi:hypothetical protein